MQLALHISNLGERISSGFFAKIRTVFARYTLQNGLNMNFTIFRRLDKTVTSFEPLSVATLQVCFGVAQPALVVDLERAAFVGIPQLLQDPLLCNQHTQGEVSAICASTLYDIHTHIYIHTYIYIYIWYIYIYIWYIYIHIIFILYIIWIEDKSDFGLQEVKNPGRMELSPFTVAFLSGRRHALFPGVYWQHEAEQMVLL